MDFHVFSFLVLQSYGKASEKPLLSRFFSTDERILFEAMEHLRRRWQGKCKKKGEAEPLSISILSKLSAHCDKMSYLLNWHVACKYTE
jgi:hypothetical protein